jgi:hypothetical protein
LFFGGSKDSLASTPIASLLEHTRTHEHAATQKAFHVLLLPLVLIALRLLPLRFGLDGAQRTESHEQDQAVAKRGERLANQTCAYLQCKQM